MAYENSPSSVMYAELKQLGVSNREVAIALLDTQRTFGDATIMDRIYSRTRLSRDIVHVAPGALSSSLFKDYAQSVQALLARVLSKLRANEGGNAAAVVSQRMTATSASAMAEALGAYGIDSNVYRNAQAHIASLDLDSETDRALLHLMLFVVTGCTGDPGAAAATVERFSRDNVGLSFKTLVVAAGANATSDASGESGADDVLFGLMRIVNGKLKGADGFYPLSPTPQGTEIGALASGVGAITDVDGDVSRRHARVFKQGPHWYIEGLKSTNGTTVISGDDKREYVVEPPRRDRPRDWEPEPYEISAADTICLGSSTRFMVIPIAG